MTAAQERRSFVAVCTSLLRFPRGGREGGSSLAEQREEKPGQGEGGDLHEDVVELSEALVALLVDLEKRHVVQQRLLG